jgi:hypothetical protein
MPLYPQNYPRIIVAGIAPFFWSLWVGRLAKRAARDGAAVSGCRRRADGGGCLQNALVGGGVNCVGRRVGEEMGGDEIGYGLVGKMGTAVGLDDRQVGKRLLETSDIVHLPASLPGGAYSQIVT